MIIDSRGWTQPKVAEALGITRQTLNAKLTGKSPFKLRDVEALCELAGMDPMDFDASRRALEEDTRLEVLPPVRVSAGRSVESDEPVIGRPGQQVWVKVEGESMSPRFEPGWSVRVVPATLDTLQPGDAVIAELNGSSGKNGSALFEFYGDAERVRLLKRNPASRFRRDEVECTPGEIAAMYKVVDVRQTP